MPHESGSSSLCVVSYSFGTVLELVKSDSSHYTCQASITITGVGFVSGEASGDLLLTIEMIDLSRVAILSIRLTWSLT